MNLVTLPFERSAVCLEEDCGRLFEIEARRCPTCASEKFMPLAAWLGERKAAA